MAILSSSLYRTILVIFALYSMCDVIKVVQGRFLWDLSLYCINYCSRVNGQTPPIGVCSCHRIASYHRRSMELNDPQTELDQDFENYNYEQPMENTIS